MSSHIDAIKILSPRVKIRTPKQKKTFKPIEVQIIDNQVGCLFPSWQPLGIESQGSQNQLYLCDIHHDGFRIVFSICFDEKSYIGA